MLCIFKKTREDMLSTFNEKRLYLIETESIPWN